MFKALGGTIVALGIAATCLATTAPVAQAGVTLDIGNVAFGFQDGYWDQSHHWHNWRNAHEARSYRSSANNHYNNYRHDRDSDNGWHK